MINIIANLIGRFWGVLSLIIFTPIYISLLGESQYGIVGFYLMLISFLTIFDLGFSIAANREMAKKSTLEYKASVIKTFQTIYFIFAFIIAVIFLFYSEFISQEWLNLNGLDIEANIIITLMGLCLALQFPTVLYNSALMGMEKQVSANLYQIIWGVVRGVGSVLVLYFYNESLKAFFLAQLVSNVIYLVVLYIACWSELNNLRVSFNKLVLKNTWKFTSGMFLLGVLALISVQMDKVFVSKFFDIKLLGFYSISATIASIPLIFSVTVTKAIFPKMVRSSQNEKDNNYGVFYLAVNDVIATVVLLCTLTLILVTKEVLSIWGASNELTEIVGGISAILVMAQLLTSMTVLPYNLAVSSGHVRTNLFFLILTIFSLLLFIIVFGREGLDAVARSVLITQAAIFFPYTFFLHNKLMKEVRWSWLIMMFKKIALFLSVAWINIVYLDFLNLLPLSKVIFVLSEVIIIIILLFIFYKRNGTFNSIRNLYLVS